MQTQAELGALIGRLAMADEELCQTLLATTKRISEENPDCLLPDDASNLAEWVRFIRCLRNSLPVNKLC
ncbi:MAG: hypothetical protein R3Y11_09325 [Pseudomonadota bacterium]